MVGIKRPTRIRVNAKRESALQQHRLVGRESETQHARFLNRVSVGFHYSLWGFERDRASEPRRNAGRFFASFNPTYGLSLKNQMRFPRSLRYLC